MSDEHVSFGVLAPLSKPLSPRARDVVDGARLAVDDLNVRGGVIGRRVELVKMDDGCTADGGAKSARKLAADETVAGALGAVCAPAAAAAARIFGRTNLPFLVTSARSPEVLDPARAPSTFLLPGTPYQEALAAAHWLALEGVQRLAAVAEEDADSRFLVDKLAFVADPVPKLVSRQTVTREGLDAELVAGAALASNPDVVYWAGSAAGAGRLVAALRSAGYKGIFLASSLSESPAFVADGGDAAEGAFVVAPARPQQLGRARAWARRFGDAYGRAPGNDALQAYDAVRALAQAVSQSGKVEHAGNTRQLSSLDLEFETPLGAVQFARDHTIQQDDHIVLVVRNGVFRTENPLRSQNG